VIKNKLLFDQYTDNCEMYADNINDVSEQIKIWLNLREYNNRLVVHCDNGDYKFDYNSKREPINSFTPKK